MKQFELNTKILVTGVAGFIGSNIAEYLIEQGVFVRGIDNLSTGSLDNISKIKEKSNFDFIKGDITDLNLMIEITKDIDYIIHQAAWGSVPRSIKLPIFYESNNVIGTLNVFESARINSIKKVIYASSSSVYGDIDMSPKVEEKIGHVMSPYALTKKSNEEYARLYFHLYGLETIGLRYFNVFGKRQNPNGDYAAVIPKFIQKVLNNETCEIYGDGLQSRDFTYIDNVVEANIKACLSTSKVGGQVLNIAYGETTNLITLHTLITKYLNKMNQIEFKDKRIGDVHSSLANINKAKKLIDYSPKYSLEEGLQETIKWFLNRNEE